MKSGSPLAFLLDQESQRRQGSLNRATPAPRRGGGSLVVLSQLSFSSSPFSASLSKVCRPALPCDRKVSSEVYQARLGKMCRTTGYESSGPQRWTTTRNGKREREAMFVSLVYGHSDLGAKRGPCQGEGDGIERDVLYSRTFFASCPPTPSISSARTLRVVAVISAVRLEKYVNFNESGRSHLSKTSGEERTLPSRLSHDQRRPQ